MNSFVSSLTLPRSLHRIVPDIETPSPGRRAGSPGGRSRMVQVHSCQGSEINREERRASRQAQIARTAW